MTLRRSCMLWHCTSKCSGNYGQKCEQHGQFHFKLTFSFYSNASSIQDSSKWYDFCTKPQDLLYKKWDFFSSKLACQRNLFHSHGNKVLRSIFVTVFRLSVEMIWWWCEFIVRFNFHVDEKRFIEYIKIWRNEYMMQTIYLRTSGIF